MQSWVKLLAAPASIQGNNDDKTTTTVKPTPSIHLGIAVVFCLLSWAVHPIQAQMKELPKPGPEQQKLHAWVGQWEYKGAELETPLGVKGEFKGKSKSRLLANGFVLESDDVEKNGDWLSLTWYDPSTKSYVSESFHPSGAVTRGQVTVTGNTWTTVSDMIDNKGKHYKTRSTTTFSADGKSLVGKQEYSLDDGKTWLLWWESSSKKVGK
jgi:hypothetical protein